ncbi:MAG: uroporphyrinogen decarboxylase family protein [Chthonomonadales bacterium]
MTSRERVRTALNHREPDLVPLDLGGSTVTGMHVSSVYRLRQALGLDPPGTPVKVIEPVQMLGEIAPDLRKVLGVDVVRLAGTGTAFGFRNTDWKEWRLWDGTPVLVPGGFNTEPEPNGDILQYPQGDRTAPPSGRMPAGGYYFDVIVRQPPLDAEPRVEDNLEEFGLLSNEDVEYLGREAARLYNDTDAAILANFGGTGFGDIAKVPAPQLRYPKGIRDVAEWYMSLTTRRDFVYAIFERQCEIGVANLQRIYNAVGDRVTAVVVTGTDFGAQNGPFVSPKTYRDLFMPFHRIINDWIHRNTGWKTFIHSCGSVRAFLEDFIAAGFDILNPVQCSAAHMDPRELKARFGERITFWGGGVDTQHTLPFGTVEDVEQEVAERIRIFAPGGGFVFNPVHNVQAATPVENLLALYRAVQRHRAYPVPSA